MEGKVIDIRTENGEGLEQKRDTVADRLLKRQEERNELMEKRRQEHQNTKVTEESSKFFTDTFTQESDEIRNQLSNIGKLSKQQLSDRFDTLTEKLQKLQKFVTDSTRFLTSYDIRRSQVILTDLQSLLTAKRNELIPKKKFAFKSRKKESAEPPTGPPVTKIDAGSKQPEANPSFRSDALIYSDKISETIVLGEDVNMKDVEMGSLENCVVKILGVPSTLHLHNMKNTTILSGPVSTSIFIDQCSGCKFVIACQQLRCHHTRESEFYLHVTSRGIIEDTQTVRFAPYNFSHPKTDEHFKLAGLNPDRNNWNDIDDFNWLAKDVHSPNWSILPEGERIKSWNDL